MNFFSKQQADEIEGVSTSALDMAKGRLLFVLGVLFLGYLAITLRLADLTLFRESSSQKQIVTKADGSAVIESAQSLRGTILDRNGELIATSLKMASVHVDATVVEKPEKLARTLAGILSGSSEVEIFKKLTSGKKFTWLARNITPKQVYAINKLGEPAISFEDEGRRIYPNENLTAHITGYTDIDGKGISGVEKAFDKQLSEGDVDVRLTIDMRIQHLFKRELEAAMKKFTAKAAIGMVMDVKTGEILAMVSLPDFNPYKPGAAADDAKFNRATLGVFEMGSTFKLFSTAAALDSGRVGFGSVYNTQEPIKIGRFTISDYHPEGYNQNVAEIFMHSSNIGTARMAQTLGGAGLKEFYKKMGFFDTVPMIFPERGAPLYPKPWKEVSTLTTSFGHGIAVSPLHVMRAASALVNGGIMVKPTIVYDPNKKPDEGVRVVREETSHKIRQLLELTVAAGTGSKAKVDGYLVGGKTGTAEKTMGRSYSKNAVLSSFIGVFPVDKPRYAILAIMDEPHATKDTYGYATGGWTAAPVVARVIEQMGPLYKIAPNFNPGHDIKKDMAIYLKNELKGEGVAASGNDH